MKLSRVEIITGISKIEPLKKALGKFHITGMTVYQVLGCGVQHGTQEFEVDVTQQNAIWLYYRQPSSQSLAATQNKHFRCLFL